MKEMVQNVKAKAKAALQGHWFGSIVVPCLIVGLFFALLGWAIYRFSLRDSIRHIEEQFRVIYDMMHLAREGVDAVTKLFFRT